jgi:uncharacterized membrane-anchored protein YhcB (DUF1043 family)
MTPNEYEYLQESLKEVKTGLESVRSEVHGNAITQGNALASVAQKVSDLQDRLFLDSTSAIPRLTDGLNHLDKRFTNEIEKENQQCSDDRKELRDDIVSLKVKMAYVTMVYGICSAVIVTLIAEGIKWLVAGHAAASTIHP